MPARLGTTIRADDLSASSWHLVRVTRCHDDIDELMVEPIRQTLASTATGSRASPPAMP
jgi:hypothetical protein